MRLGAFFHEARSFLSPSFELSFTSLRVHSHSRAIFTIRLGAKVSEWRRRPSVVIPKVASVIPKVASVIPKVASVIPQVASKEGCKTHSSQER